MPENNPCEGLNLRLDLSDQRPDILFAVYKNEEGSEFTVAEGVLDGLKSFDTLSKRVNAIIEEELPQELLSDQVKKRLTEQFRASFYDLFPPLPDYE